MLVNEYGTLGMELVDVTSITIAYLSLTVCAAKMNQPARSMLHAPIEVGERARRCADHCQNLVNRISVPCG